MRPEFVYFDLGNVLLFFDHDLAMRKMARIAGVTFEQMRTIVMDSNLQIEYETGSISSLQFVSRISDAVSRDLDKADMLQAAADMFIPNPHILPVLQRVRELGIPTGLLSNTCEAHWHWIVEQQYPQVKGWFQPIVLSYEAKSMKPARSIYQQAEKLAGVPSSSIFFTDDRPDNVQAAVDAGWQAEVFVNADRLMKTVDQW
jgi:putative hydrolase of the HAD superfamily